MNKNCVELFLFTIAIIIFLILWRQCGKNVTPHTVIKYGGVTSETRNTLVNSSDIIDRDSIEEKSINRMDLVYTWGNKPYTNAGLKNKLKHAKKELYSTVRRGQQIACIVANAKRRFGAPGEYMARLLNLIAFRVNVVSPSLYTMLYAGKSDAEIYAAIGVESAKKVGGGDNIDITFESEGFTLTKNTSVIPRRLDIEYEEFFTAVRRYIRDLLTKVVQKDIKYLDVGCGEGFKTKLMARELGIVSGNIYSCDIKKWSNFDHSGVEDNSATSPVQFSLMLENPDGTTKIQHADGSMHILSVMMVLHHVEKIGAFLIELRRVLAPGGYLIVTEHDVHTNTDAMLCDVEHRLYTLEMPVEDVPYSRYFSWFELDALMIMYDFEYCGADFIRDDIMRMYRNPSAKIYAVYRKK